MRRPELTGVAPLFARECWIALRAPAFWAVAGACALLAVWRATGPGATAAIAAYRTCEFMIIGLGVVAVFLAGSAAGRDRRTGAEQLVLAKPEGSAPLVVVMRFCALWLSLVAIALIALAAASLSQIVFARTPWQVHPYVHALARAVLPIGMAAALGFCLSTIFHTPLASAVAAVYWIVIPLSRPHIAMAFDLTLSQHRVVAALLTAFLVALASALYARSIRDRGASSGRLMWVTAVLLVGVGVSAYQVATSGEDVLTGPDPVLAAMASQSIHSDPRAPGFWLADQSGRLVGMSDFAGRPVLLAFWGPAVSDSAQVLPALGSMSKEFGPRGLACIAISVDRDPATLSPFVGEAGPGVAMLWDRGRHFGEGTYEVDSPMAVAYDITALPAMFLLDRDRRVVMQAPTELSAEWLRRQVRRIVER